MLDKIILPQIEITRHRIEELKGVSEGDAHLAEALAELDVALEELNAAVEEMERNEERIEQISREMTLQRKEFQLFFNLIPYPLIYTTAAGIILDVNSAAEALFAVNHSWLVGKPLPSFIPVEGRREFRITLGHVITKGTLSKCKFNICPRVGHEVMVSARAATDYDNSGHAQRVGWTLEVIGPADPPNTAETA